MTNELCHDATYLIAKVQIYMVGYLLVHLASGSICLRQLLGICPCSPCDKRLGIVKTQFGEFSLPFNRCDRHVCLYYK